MADFTTEARVVISATDKTGAVFKNINQQVHTLSTRLAVAAGKFAIIKYAMEMVAAAAAAPFKLAIDTVEQYKQSVLAVTGLLATKLKPSIDLGEGFRQALMYSEGLVQVVEQLAGKTALTHEEVTAMVSEIIRAGGIIPNVYDPKQLQALTTIANALAVSIQGAPNRLVQVFQEIRALMQGEVGPHSPLARTIDAMLGGTLRKNVEQWKQQGVILDVLADKLKGMQLVSVEVGNTFSAQMDRLKVTLIQILRPAFTSFYNLVVSGLKNINDWMERNRDTLKNWASDLQEIFKVTGPNPFLLIPGVILKRRTQGQEEIEGKEVRVKIPEEELQKYRAEMTQKMLEDVFAPPPMPAEQAKKLEDLINKFNKIAETAGLKKTDLRIAEIEQDYQEFVKEYGENLEALRAKERAIAALRAADYRELLKTQEKLEAEFTQKTISSAIETEKQIIETKRQIGVISEEEKVKRLSQLKDEEVKAQIDMQKRLSEITDDAEERLQIEYKIRELELQLRDTTLRSYEIQRAKAEDAGELLDTFRQTYNIHVAILDAQQKSLLEYKKEPEYLKERIRLLDEYIEKVISIKPLLEPKEQLKLEENLNQLIIERSELLEEYALKTGSVWYGIQLGFKELEKNVESAAESAKAAVENVANAMEKAFEQFFDYTSKGFGDLKTLVKNVMRDIYMEIMKSMVIKPIASSLLGGVKGWLGGLFGTPSVTPAEGQAWMFEVKHKGGVVGEGSGGLFEFIKGTPQIFEVKHTGGFVGLKPDEVPTILQKGEYVLSKKAVALLASKQAGNVEVNVINNTPISVGKGDVTTAYDADLERFIVNVVLKDIHTGGRLRPVLKGA